MHTGFGHESMSRNARVIGHRRKTRCLGRIARLSKRIFQERAEGLFARRHTERPLGNHLNAVISKKRAELA